MVFNAVLLRRPGPFALIKKTRDAFRSSSSSSGKNHFVARQTFPVPPNNSFTWFPGHMLAGLRALASTISDIDLIIETRDARIPLSSRNPYLEDVCAGKRRLVLYNKRDLAGLSERQEDVCLLVESADE
jgi:hypothetical protein